MCETVDRTRRVTWFRQPVVWAALYSLVLLVAGPLLHPILAWTAELDNYVGQARRMWEGQWPYDVYHPLGYPVLTALAGALPGDYFFGARCVSACSAGLLVWSAFHLVRPAFGPVAAWTAMAAVAVHPLTVDSGLQMQSDIMAAAMIALTLVLAGRMIHSEGLRWPIATGLAFALAYWSRYPALALLVALVPALWLYGPRGWRLRLRRSAAFAGGAVLGLVPHCVLTYLQFGELLHDENWRNLAMAHYGRVAAGYDFDYLGTNPFDSWLSVVMHDPLRILHQGTASVRDCFRWTLPMQLTGDAEWPPGWVEWIVLAAAGAGGVVAYWLRRPILVLAGLFSVCYLVAVAITLGAWDRFLLPCLAPLLGAATVCTWVIGAAFAHWPWVARLIQLGVAIALVAYVGGRVPAKVRDLQRLEPHPELAAIRDLVEQHGNDVVIGTIMCQLAEHASFDVRWLPRDYGTTTDAREFHATDYVVRCVEMAATAELDYLVLGALTFGGPWQGGHERLAALAHAPLPPDFERVRQDDDVLIWRVRKPFRSAGWRPASAGWRHIVALTPNPIDSGALRLEIDLRPVSAQVETVTLLAEDPHQQTHRFVDLPRDEDRVSLQVPAAEIMKGDWSVRAQARLSTGLVYGPRVVLSVR